MLKTRLLHPELLETLARAGHGSRVLIADGNYPFETGSSERARKVFLNLAPGMLRVTDVLKVLVKTIPVESASVMVPPDRSRQAIFDDFERLLPQDIRLENLDRFDFYEAARSRDTVLVIATGDKRKYANLLLTIGVV